MTTAEKLFTNLEFLYENIYNLLIGYEKARTSSNDIIIPLRVRSVDENGREIVTTENVKIESFDKLFTELKRLDNNFKSLTNTDNISYLLNADGSLSQITKTSFINAEYLGNISDFIDEKLCITDKDSFVKNLVFPNVKIPVELSNKLISDIYAHIFDISYGWDKVLEVPKDELTILKMRYMIDNGEIIANESNITLEPQKQRVSYFGRFDIINVETIPNNNNDFNVELNTTKYEGLNTFGIVIDLRVGDMLVDNEGLSKYQITNINTLTNRLTIKRIAGNEVPKTGLNKLYFNENLETSTNIVGIPVQPRKQMVVFLSTKNHKNISYPTRGIRIDTAQYKVNHDNKTYSIDDFFAEKVINFSSYFESILQEQTIPFSLGLKPDKPELDIVNFNVIQINKHITNEKSRQTIETLNIEKQKIKNRLEYLNTEVNSVQNEIDTLKFKSEEEKVYRLEKINDLRIEINTLEQNLLNVTRNIDNNAVETGIKKLKPKYRILGAWKHQQPIYSPKTKPQHIIKYEVQYRYLSKNVDTVESTNMKLITDGKEITFNYSPWIIYESRTLQKIKNPNNTIEWEQVSYSNADDININQVSIPIQENESVEIRVRAVSEAGYPISPVMSEWSEILRIDFPLELTENNLNSVVNKNVEDLLTAEFNNILKSSGILSHISQQVKESEKLFFHKAEDITSGFYTPEQKNISLFEYLKRLTNEINILKNTDNNKNILIEVVDFHKEIYTISNNSTLELFAGNYSDEINLIDSEQFGSIIQKQAMIRIKNPNQYPIEIKSQLPGNLGNELTQSNAEHYFNVPVRNGSTTFQQETKQIFYFRNKDINGQNDDVFKLVKPKANHNIVELNNNILEQSAPTEQHNILYLNSAKTNLLSGKINPRTKNDGGRYFGYTNEIPESSTPQKQQQIITELKRMFDNFNGNIQALNYQTETNSSVQNYYFGFKDIDFYAVGKYTTGAFLIPLINNPTNIKVIGDTVLGSLTLQPNQEILIPILFQYRMMDRFGIIYDNKTDNVLNISDDLTYQKKIGFSMLINNTPFNFDLQVSAKLQSPIKPIDKLNINSINAKYVRENKSKLIP